ncbi:MAG: hypothetical protein WCP52_08975 [Bacteroidota bacterium]
MVSPIVCLAGLFVAGAAWLASNKNTEKSNNEVTYDEGNRSQDKNENNFLDFSGGLLGI